MSIDPNKFTSPDLAAYACGTKVLFETRFGTGVVVGRIAQAGLGSGHCLWATTHSVAERHICYMDNGTVFELPLSWLGSHGQRWEVEPTAALHAAAGLLMAPDGVLEVLRAPAAIDCVGLAATIWHAVPSKGPPFVRAGRLVDGCIGSGCLNHFCYTKPRPPGFTGRWTTQGDPYCIDIGILGPGVGHTYRWGYGHPKDSDVIPDQLTASSKVYVYAGPVHCKRCNLKNDHGVLNQPDGSYLCYECR